MKLDVCEKVARAFLFQERRKRFNTEITEDSREESAGEREDEQVAFSGNDDGEGAAVARNGEITEAQAVKHRNVSRLRYGNFVICRNRRKLREIDPDEIAGFFLNGALEEDAGFVQRPAKDTQANAKMGHAIE